MYRVRVWMGTGRSAHPCIYPVGQAVNDGYSVDPFCHSLHVSPKFLRWRGKIIILISQGGKLGTFSPMNLGAITREQSHSSVPPELTRGQQRMHFCPLRAIFLFLI